MPKALMIAKLGSPAALEDALSSGDVKAVDGVGGKTFYSFVTLKVGNSTGREKKQTVASGMALDGQSYKALSDQIASLSWSFAYSASEQKAIPRTSTTTALKRHSLTITQREINIHIYVFLYIYNILQESIIQTRCVFSAKKNPGQHAWQRAPDGGHGEGGGGAEDRPEGLEASRAAAQEHGRSQVQRAHGRADHGHGGALDELARGRRSVGGHARSGFGPQPQTHLLRSGCPFVQHR